MSFAAFILKLEADAKGVEKGVNTAQTHFKRLGATVKDIETRVTKEREKQTKLAWERLKPEEKMVSLLRTREQIANRLARVEDPRTRNLYLQKQLELEKQIASARAAGSVAGGSTLGRVAGSLLGRAALVGTVAGGTVVAGANQSNALQDLSLTTGLSIGGLEKLQVGADATDTTFGGLTGAARSVRTSQSAALNGNQKMLKAFEQAGLGIDDLRTMSAEEIFFKLAGGGANVGNVSALTKIFGEGNSDEVIKAFGNGFGKAVENLERFNLGMDESTIQALAEFKDGLGQATAVFKQVGRWALNGLAGGFLALGKRTKGLLTGNFVDANAEADLIGDDEYSASLAATARLTRALDLAKMRREGREEDAAEAAEEEARRYFRGYHADKSDRTDHVRSNGSNHIDTDEMAMKGLYVGSGMLMQQRQINELQKVVSELQELNRKVED